MQLAPVPMSRPETIRLERDGVEVDGNRIFSTRAVLEPEFASRLWIHRT